MEILIFMSSFYEKILNLFGKKDNDNSLENTVANAGGSEQLEDLIDVSWAGYAAK